MPERPVSATIFGILNIAFGLFNIANLLLEDSFKSLAANSSNPSANSVFALIESINSDPGDLAWHHVFVPCELLANAVLVAAGIGLLLLKNWGRVASLVCAIYRLVAVVVNTAVFGFAVHGLIKTALSGLSSLLVLMLAVAAVVVFLLTLTYPACLVYFMTRRKIILACQPFTSPPPPNSSL